MHTRGLHAGFVVNSYLAHLLRPLQTMHHAQDNEDGGVEVDGVDGVGNGLGDVPEATCSAVSSI